MGWNERNKAVVITLDAFIVVLTVFFVLMTAMDLVGARILTGYHAQIAFDCAVGLSVLLPARFIVAVRSGSYE